MNKEDILDLLVKLNVAAQDYDEYYFGLPIYDETEEQFVEIVNNWIEKMDEKNHYINE